MSTLTDEQQRIRNYLQAQAAKLSTADLVAKVRADEEQLRVGAEAVPPHRFSDHPAAGGWSANEVLSHVVTYGARVVDNIRTVIDGRQPVPQPADAIGSVDPDPPRRTAAEWWAELTRNRVALTRNRVALYERVGQVTGDEHLNVTWSHPSFGDLNWREWLLFLRLHDLDHARQLQAIAANLLS